MKGWQQLRFSQCGCCKVCFDQIRFYQNSISNCWLKHVKLCRTSSPANVDVETLDSATFDFENQILANIDFEMSTLAILLLANFSSGVLRFGSNAALANAKFSNQLVQI